MCIKVKNKIAQKTIIRETDNENVNDSKLSRLTREYSYNGVGVSALGLLPCLQGRYS